MSAVKLVCEEIFTVYIGGSQSALPKRLLESRSRPTLGLLNQGPASAPMLQTLPAMLILAEF